MFIGLDYVSHFKMIYIEDNVADLRLVQNLVKWRSGIEPISSMTGTRFLITLIISWDPVTTT